MPVTFNVEHSRYFNPGTLLFNTGREGAKRTGGQRPTMWGLFETLPAGGAGKDVAVSRIGGSALLVGEGFR